MTFSKKTSLPQLVQAKFFIANQSHDACALQGLPSAQTKAYDKTGGLLNAWACCRMFCLMADALLVAPPLN
jgi:hypothetical protein